MNNKRSSGVPASPQDDLLVLREASKEYERLRAAAAEAAHRRKILAAAASKKHTYAALAEAAGVSVGHAHVLVNGRAA